MDYLCIMRQQGKWIRPAASSDFLWHVAQSRGPAEKWTGRWTPATLEYSQKHTTASWAFARPSATHQGYTKTHLCEESLPNWQLRFCAAALRRRSTKSRLQSFILISSVNILTGNIWVYFLGLSMPEDLDFLGQQEQARAKIKFNWIHWANK